MGSLLSWEGANGSSQCTEPVQTYKTLLLYVFQAVAVMSHIVRYLENT